jgi:hypothetical protein
MANESSKTIFKKRNPGPFLGTGNFPCRHVDPIAFATNTSLVP